MAENSKQPSGGEFDADFDAGFQAGSQDNFEAEFDAEFLADFQTNLPADLGDLQALNEGLACEAVWLAATAGVRVAVAESLTGGALASAIVGVPGASAVFVGGVVAYDTEVKQQLLGVDGDLLAEGGPVQAEVARQMACDVRAALGVAADIGLATTGVAGPDPDLQTGQLPGTVFVGLVSSVSSRAVRLPVLAGDRAFIRAAAVNAALRLLIAEFAV